MAHRNAAGARGLCCRSTEDVRSALAAAPRWAVHRALAEREPRDYCAAGDPDAAQQLGVLPSMEDAAIAYRLLLEVWPFHDLRQKCTSDRNSCDEHTELSWHKRWDRESLRRTCPARACVPWPMSCTSMHDLAYLVS